MSIENAAPVPSKVLMALEELGDHVDNAAELARLVPIAKAVLGALAWARSWRMRRFLRVLDAEIAAGGTEAMARFEEIVGSEAGAELLTDFADGVLRTASPTAIAALGILYARSASGSPPSAFQQLACAALPGLNEAQVDFFLTIADLTEADRLGSGEEPYLVFNLEAVANRKEQILVLAPSAALRVAMLLELQRRGMVLPDHSSRYGTGGALHFGLGEHRDAFCQLLLQARTYLGTET